MFDYKVVNSALDNLLISGSEIFIDYILFDGIPLESVAYPVYTPKHLGNNFFSFNFVIEKTNPKQVSFSLKIPCIF